MKEIMTKEEAKAFAEDTENKELFEWVLETMKERLEMAGMEYKDYTTMHDAIVHVCRCIRSLVQDAFGIMGAGDFIQNVIKNDLGKAVAYADGINMKNLDIYVTFMFNYLPNPDYLKQLRNKNLTEGG